MSENQYTVNSGDVVAEIIDGEAILIDMTTGCYYSLEQTACKVWEILVAGPATPSALAAHFEGDSDTIRTELAAFLDELVGEKLLFRSEAERVSASFDGERHAYVKPVLNKYTDMENLLLMDPIHDVGERGWPVQPGDGQ